MAPLPRSDRAGRLLTEGDRVRIVGVPDLAGMSSEGRSETEPVFRYLVGKYKTVRGFDAGGRAELIFRFPSRTDQLHIVAIEPALLRKRRPRQARADAACRAVG